MVKVFILFIYLPKNKKIVERQKMRKDFSVIGKPVSRIDAFDKVTGRAQYTGDMVLPNMLVGKILRSPHSHAKLLNINTTISFIINNLI